ncbi:hypothetical protein PLICRDRAFT_171316, partial [Plicaturopsis crispa FD-325 SS-3]
LGSPRSHLAQQHHPAYRGASNVPSLPSGAVNITPPYRGASYIPSLPSGAVNISPLSRGASNVPSLPSSAVNVSPLSQDASSPLRSDASHPSADSQVPNDASAIQGTFPRPGRLTGITSLPAHHSRAAARVAAFLERARVVATMDGKDGEDAHDGPGAVVVTKDATEVTLYCCDAVFRPGDAVTGCRVRADNSHPLDPSLITHPLDPTIAPDGTYDTILALDCAYHFSPRAAFLAQAHARLRPGGRVALADICWEDEGAGDDADEGGEKNGEGEGEDGEGSRPRPSLLASFHRRLRYTLLTLLLPRANLLSRAAYAAQMKQLGYVDVKMEDVSGDVFPGFLRFLGSRGKVWWIFAAGLGWVLGREGRFVVVVGRKA